MTWRSFSVIAAIAIATPLSVPMIAQDGAWPPPGVVRMGTGVQSPTIVKETKPHYTAAAMSAKIQGLVEVEAVVLATGKVGDVRVLRSLDKEHGLDASAVQAVKEWEFKPGRKDGKVVPVLVNIELTFALRK
jgi:periplasmic protein TonB